MGHNAWVRPDIEHAQDVPLVGEAMSILRFSLWAEPLFVFNLLFLFYQVFFFFFYLVSLLFSKVKNGVMGLSFDFLVFYLISLRLESKFQKNKLTNFNLGLLRFEYRGTFFLSRAFFGFVALASCIG